MSKRPSKLKLRTEYLGLKCLVLFIKIMPWSVAVKFGEVLGSVLSKFLPNRFKRTLYDIKKAFPQKSVPEIFAIAEESWANMGRVAAEFIKCSRMSKEQLARRVEFRNFDKLFEYSNQGKGGILHIGHFVNWEVLGLAAGYYLKRMCFVARPQTNPYVNEELTKYRTRTGAKMISSYNPFFSCFKMLKKGYMIGILSDHSVKSEAALYMNFMGRPAEVPPMTAVLALKMKLPIFPVRALRENGKIIIEAQDIIYPPDAKYSSKAVADLTRALTDKYEEWIKEDPASWLWAHNRWKREKAAGEKMMQAQAACDE
jgi:KDO2-lipid IV(A) lauroyltransferase